MVHHILMRDTLDQLVVERLNGKREPQDLIMDEISKRKAKARCAA